MFNKAEFRTHLTELLIMLGEFDRDEAVTLEFDRLVIGGGRRTDFFRQLRTLHLVNEADVEFSEGRRGFNTVIENLTIETEAMHARDFIRYLITVLR